jgi:cytoskeletal protein CcmA (bactofilin family)
MPQQSDNVNQAAAPIVPGRPAEERRQTAWVGQSVVFRGELIAMEDLMVDGRVEGTIELRDHRLIVGPDALISADISAHSVTIFGKVKGKVTASGTVDVRETGSVEGDIACSRLAVAEGATLHGRMHTRVEKAAAAAAPVKERDLTPV